MEKKRVDKVAQRLYGKDWESLVKPQSKYRAMAVAIEEAENEIDELKGTIEISGYKDSNESDENISKVVFFELQNGKYVTKKGKEITIDFLIQHEHVIMNDNGYIVLERN